MAPPRRRMAGGAALGGEVVDEDVDVFDAGEVADDFGVDPGDGLEFVRASLRGCGARRSRWRRGAPTRRACGSRGRVIGAAHLGAPSGGSGQKVCKVFHSCGLGLDFEALQTSSRLKAG